ncbi:Solute carrier 13 [Perkinsus chesapeaki]|uniref:Solute carrier 13 n=1 Tax=Perkinsus chesapeaki TaxID=330153 RepID=A0A7J6LDA4_PERCH|nr:Solute carrier 13 [Perkinsus chesapeaki]
MPAREYQPVPYSTSLADSPLSSGGEDSGGSARTRKASRVLPEETLDQMETASLKKGRISPSSRFVWPTRRQLTSAGLGVFLGVLAAVLPLGFSSSDGAAQRCLGILIASAVWWVLEPWPPYVTSLCLGLLIVVFRVMRVPDPSSMALVPARIVGSEIGDGELLPPSAAATVVSSAYFDPVIFLFISGFAMGQALEKYHITERLARRLLARVATGGDKLSLVILSLGLLVSGALSNVAAAVLLTAVVAPVARELSDTEAKRTVLSVAFGYRRSEPGSTKCYQKEWHPAAQVVKIRKKFKQGNVGGMITPIASPQNVIALVALRSNGGSDLSFMQWIIFALPVCVLSALAVFTVLKFIYRGERSDATKTIELKEKRGVDTEKDSVASEVDESHAPLNSTDWTVIGIVCSTVFLWMIFDIAGLQSIFGNMGIIGLMSVVAFHCLGILTTEDWQGMQWSVLTLLGGGVALGNAVESSGLLRILANGISKSLEGASVWASATCFFVCTGLVANFLSSTVCAIIALPVVAKVGAVVGHPRLFTVGCALMTSAAMGLPVSSFPNANAAGVVHLSLPGAPPAPVLQSKDFVKSGFPVALLILISLSTFGYAWAMMLGW